MSLERIEITPFAMIVGDILQNRRTGQLTILRPPLRKVAYWSQGELVLITSTAPEDSLGDFLVRRGIIPPERALKMTSADPVDVVSRFHEAGLLELSWRQTLLREWLATQIIPLFALDEGTSLFTEEEPIAPERRVFLQSTAGVVLEGIRSITNGLVLRRSLGDLKRRISWARDTFYSIDTIPLTDPERSIAMSLGNEAQAIEGFLKQFSTESVTAARVVIAMLTLGLYAIAEEHEMPRSQMSFDDMQRDLELLAAIGAGDQRSLRAVAMSRQLSSLDHYQILEIPRAATRNQIIAAGEAIRKKFDPKTYPPLVRDAVTALGRRAEEAVRVLADGARRADYDKLVHERGSRPSEVSMQQRMNQRSIADQNFAKARELVVQGDYYGAIVLLKQAVRYVPENAQAWFLLGTCQERNPKWRREAAESLQMALSIDPDFIDAMISLGDLYKSEGLIARAQSCYEDVLRISPENAQALNRIQSLRKR